jgi:hypothetical protein
VRDWVKNRVDSIVSLFSRLSSQVRSAMNSVSETIQAPFRKAFDAIKSLWNSTVGGFGFSVPDWVPGAGGKGFSIPKMHQGGTVPGAPGEEVLMLLQAGEQVLTESQQRNVASGLADTRPSAVASVSVELVAAGVDEALLEWLRGAVRIRGGGDVQLALGV